MLICNEPIRMVKIKCIHKPEFVIGNDMDNDITKPQVCNLANIDDFRYYFLFSLLMGKKRK